MLTEMQQSSRYKKSSTISVLKFNRISLKNCNISQTESEASGNSIRKEQKNITKINSNNQIQQEEAFQQQFRRTKTSILPTKNQEFSEQSPEKNNHQIDEFNEFQEQEFPYSPYLKNETRALSKEDLPSFKLDLSKENEQKQQTKHQLQSSGASQDNTSKRLRISKWIDDEQQNTQQSKLLTQKISSKLQSQVLLNRSPIKEIINPQNQFNILLKNMEASLQDLKQFRHELDEAEQQKSKAKKQEQQERFPTTINKNNQEQNKSEKNLKQIITPVNNYYKPQQAFKQKEQSQLVVQQNYISKSRNSQLDNNKQKSNRTKSQTGIVIELREQVNAQFNRTPERQPNYKSITPVRQIIKCVDLNDNRNDKLFSILFRIKNGKQINVIMRRNDNLIKVAQDAAQKYKLEHNTQLQLLKALKEKYKMILENQV